MPARTLTRQRLTVLFLFGLLGWFSPVVLRFESAGLWFGVPALYLYLFGIWGLLVLGAALVLTWRD